jgi:hypothetical protein
MRLAGLDLVQVSTLPFQTLTTPSFPALYLQQQQPKESKSDRRMDLSPLLNMPQLTGCHSSCHQVSTLWASSYEIQWQGLHHSLQWAHNHLCMGAHPDAAAILKFRSSKHQANRSPAHKQLPLVLALLCSQSQLACTPHPHAHNSKQPPSTMLSGVGCLTTYQAQSQCQHAARC